MNGLAPNVSVSVKFAVTLHILLINLVIIDDPLHFSNDL